jgi:hypothetical protein
MLVLLADSTMASGRGFRARGLVSKINQKEMWMKPSRSRSFCGEGDVDGGGLTGDNDGGGAKWSRGAPTRKVMAAEAASLLALV